MATQQSEMPKVSSMKSCYSFVRQGYAFIGTQCRQLQSDVFRTRILFQDVICIRGEEAARMFYDPVRFERKGAVPKRIQKTLFGVNAIQTLDGERHRGRKELLMTFMSDASVENLKMRLTTEWETAIVRWHRKQEVNIYKEVQEVLCKAACAWAGVPLAEDSARRRAHDFTLMINSFAALGLRHWQGRRARTRTEGWLAGVIDQVRDRKINVSQYSPVYVMAHFQENGQLLTSEMAAVELINLIRPIVAIATFIAFAAMALHDFPQYKYILQNQENEFINLFTQEVRRYYPFAPFTGARVREDFLWNGYYFPKGALVLLDLYGTNHDERIWQRPGSFFPERFLTSRITPFNMIPQGGGGYTTGHRCAGEKITIETIRIALHYLAQRLDFQFAQEHIGYSLLRIPSLPAGGVQIRNVSVK